MKDDNSEDGLDPVFPHDAEQEGKDSAQSSENNADSELKHQERLTVAVGRNQCNQCGTETLRAFHEGCGAPMLEIDGEWRCGECGARTSTQATCFDCGSTSRRETMELPLDFTVAANPTEIEYAIHERTNQRRTNHGLGELGYSDHLSAIALQHSRDMAIRDFFDHESPEGQTPMDRYQKFGHGTRLSAENIAKQSPDITALSSEAADMVVEAWMNSEGHREKILTGSFNKEGIGVYLDTDGALYATQNFY